MNAVCEILRDHMAAITAAVQSIETRKDVYAAHLRDAKEVNARQTELIVKQAARLADCYDADRVLEDLSESAMRCQQQARSLAAAEMVLKFFTEGEIVSQNNTTDGTTTLEEVGRTAKYMVNACDQCACNSCEPEIDLDTLEPPHSLLIDWRGACLNRKRARTE